ncbi:amino acid transporter [Mycolicibacterium sp. BK556]|uniref:APC family permease n=1 Tax=Mycobacteriaceae TaxID=1762 RepID=UPI0010E32942|nr:MULTISPECIES: APC family permease [Mycobacteriaceae]MBB3604736.1 amino acid transporter [Mycolicibacterium sp. BK556]MBB3634551.1 amino acid transporter [Mycolicibacterium sp. BK607]MBB3752128.1 amino acid transporter [Mycolicibacterium sp. BK634]TDO17625.1 amino acid/polyamine/organocation transporter (APC superfamily) [Mycobacterium sp. BK086]
MTQELEAPASAQRDKLLTTELVPEQVLPKVMTTFGLTATYVFIICWITGSSIMAAGGWTAIPMWILGILTFLIPAGMAVAELGNLWPGEGGVYIWATRTMGETWGFIGGYLSWIPVVLNSASSPAIILQFLLLAFHAELGLTLTIILQVVILWAVIGLALAKLAANQKIMNAVFVVYWVLTAVIFVSGVIYAIRNGSAQEFTAHAALVPDFAGAGFLYGTVLLYLVGVETPYNMGAEFLSVRKSGPKMVVWGSIALILIYLLTTLGTVMVLPADEINPVTGVIGMLGTAAPAGVMEVAAVVLALIVFVALMSYQVTYSRLIFVSGLERHLPRIFTHLNPRTRNPVTAVLIQGVLSSLILVGLYSQSSMANVTVFLQGGLSIAWLISGFFFLVPVIIARKKYADRYAAEKFWRIPGGMVGVWITIVIGSVGTLGGIYYSFAKSWIADVPDSTWMTWTGSIAAGMFALGVVVYIFGRRSAHKMTQEDALAHLAVLDLKKSETPSPEAV